LIESLKRYFQLDKHQTTVQTELLAGVTTFMTMAYIIVVNPKILEAGGIPFGPSMVATILTAFLGTFLMAVYARRPFAIAPYMGENAFVAFTVVKLMGYTWQAALGATFISAAIFAVLTLLNVRTWLVHSIPLEMKIAFSVGIGLFLSFIGLNETGIVTLGVPGAPVHVGKLTEPTVALAILGFLLTGVLMIRKVTGALFLGISLTTLLGVLLGHVTLPTQWVSEPPSLEPIFAQLDLADCLRWEFFPIVLTMFVIIFVDTMGTLIAVSYKAGFLDEKGHLPEVEKPMMCDSIATMGGAVLGTTTAGAYIESAAGIEAGGRTGLTALVTALLFLVALFFSPILTVVPAFAYGPALILIGMLMIAPITRLNFEDLTEVIPVFAIILLMSFTYNLGIGMTAGFVLYPLVKLFAGRGEEVSTGLWVLGALSLLFFVFYPY
jgi:AGZA family xanthine/uracil permease-like MFS transporter